MVPLFVSSLTWLDCSVISILLGASFGLGIPSCLAYFADITHFGNRGRISGITFLIINMAAPIFFITASGLDLTANLILFAVWRSLGLIVFFLKPIEKLSTSERKASNSFSGILKDKIFGFYIIAWIMFCLVDRITSPIATTSLGDIADIITILGPIVASISALIAGIGADRIGRKRIALYGFISLGIAYAIIGISPNEPVAGYFYTVINSITTGNIMGNIHIDIMGRHITIRFQRKILCTWRNSLLSYENNRVVFNYIYLKNS